MRVIGDANKVGRIGNALDDGFNLGSKI
jgi:hypothetical protein